jgi:uncharacterized domain HDIG
MAPLEIIKEYYPEHSKGYNILVDHSISVTEKALSLAKKHPEMKLDLTFVYEAAMLHDIGIFKTNAPEIYCFGEYPYICHGYLGAELLNKKGYPRHALVCERHTGTGLSLEEIKNRELPLPHRDMMPVSLEEQLICFADKFFSKSKPEKEKSPDKIRKSLSKHGIGSVKRFDNWCRLFLG